MLSIAIVGLPNVGKSTLFNALTRSKQADAQNYPFCTIEPNVGVVEVPDERLAPLANVSNAKKIVPTAIEFWDIAGLVKNASQGEGKGNAFLSNIKETDAIAHVVRAFSDGNITHVENRLDPKDDADIINLELIMADWQAVSSRLEKTKKNAKGAQAKEYVKELALLERLAAHLDTGKKASQLEFDDDEGKIMKELHLLTSKPMMYVVNMDDSQQSTDYRPVFEEGVPHIYISAKTEQEISELSAEDAKEFMADLGIEQSGLDRMIKAGYELLDLVTFITSGEIETRAWTVKRGTTAPLAAGVIHTDFIKGFIKADVTNWEDFVAAGGWSKMKETGKLRLEGKQYVVRDGDVMYFHVAT
ncbi:MAG: redox-regulated ATPase YchF [Candidatus Magasanikbacteria bacterium CG10_big_fil_rev_8_21_14_0_10_47_10]|uniref:Ribosome-binding ATPase YchF n=1 Tax=Candidatus Magasanikbacteria bacterium CG10_big_fil_rev_8_21_14_0_10_47_10 TaxID=1974652 RepID=A0A2H0TTV0_9BACT|nr:MAG: redox-regulated ATPase YchF [Candidatus Magasanikbacteria bacterium CG10_big_fil_rev_8_21_14_0_10_47_10]